MKETESKNLSFSVALICVLATLGSQTYYALIMLFGMSGGEGGGLYYIYNGLVCLLAVMAFLTRKPNYNLSFLLPAFVILSYCISEVLGRNGEYALMYLGYFLLWSLPAYLAGNIISKRKNFISYVKIFDFVMIFFTVYGIVNAVIFMTQGWQKIGYFGTSYQQISYTTAMAYGLNIFFLTCGGDIDRYSFFKTKFWQYVCVCLLFFQFIVSIVCGGRSGLIIVILTTFYFGFPFIFNRKNFRYVAKMLKILAVIVLAFVIMYVLFENYGDNSAVVLGISRHMKTFNSDGGINWNGGGGRHGIYEITLENINRNPLGYGVFGQFELLGYSPHNIFLEWLVGCGYIGLVVMLFVCFDMFRRYFSIIQFSPGYKILGLFLIYAAINLMFSGTWVVSNILWFCFGFIFAFRPDKEQMDKLKEKTLELLKAEHIEKINKFMKHNETE